MKIEELLRDNIRRLVPYSSARDEFDATAMIQLDANENPFENGLNRYPDPYQTELKSKIADWKGVSAENLVLGNGSDELIDLLIRAFCEPGKDKVVGLTPSYGMYKVCCDINNVDYKAVAMDEDFDFNPTEVLDIVDENTKIIFLCSPNNPSGNSLDVVKIERLLNQFKGIMVIDEAYADFAKSKSWINSLDEYPQLVVLQTFSKAIGMASIRLGMAWSSKEIVEIFNRIKSPYNVNGLTQAAALEMLSQMEIVEERIQEINNQKDQLTQELLSLDVVEKVFPSDANFLLVRLRDAKAIYDYLLKQGIVVRDRSKQVNCENCLRITVGTKEQNSELIKNLKAYENEESTVY